MADNLAANRRMLEPRAVRVLLVTNRYPTSSAPYSGTFVPPLIQALKDASVIPELYFVDRNQKGRRAYHGVVHTLRSRVREFEPDVVHVLWGGFLAWLTAHAVPDRPVVITLGGDDVLGGYLFAADGLVEHLSRFVAVGSSHLAVRRSSHIICVSRNLLEALPNHVPADRCSIIPCGVDLTIFRPLDKQDCQLQLGWVSNRKHILFPALASRSFKRFELAKRTWKLLRESGHDTELHELPGVPHNEVPIWLNAADVVLITSRHEGSPTVLKEALACARPVVSVAVGDVSELLAPLDGCRIAEANPISLSSGITQIWDLGQVHEAREQIERYSWDRIAVDIARVYRSCLGGALPASEANSAASV
jgi:teichuronic acid biosynthesis glycosyltransferase TuaC